MGFRLRVLRIINSSAPGKNIVIFGLRNHAFIVLGEYYLKNSIMKMFYETLTAETVAHWLSSLRQIDQAARAEATAKTP